MNFTITQRERLTDLGMRQETMREIEESLSKLDYAGNSEFLCFEREYALKNKAGIERLLSDAHITPSKKIETLLSGWLVGEGFTRVETPTIIPLTMLDKMSVTEGDPLREQIFKVDRKKCLRPMLAPGLYVLMRELHRIIGRPVRIFEIGSCFRRESEGSKHLSEFTMLNLVEFAATEDGMQTQRLKELATAAIEAIGLGGCGFEVEDSAVYGETVDIVSAEGLELASGSYGPHRLDANWGVFEPWVGIGFGIERLALALHGGDNIKRYSKSINFLGGMSLRV